MKIYLFEEYDYDVCGMITKEIVFANSKEEALQMILDDKNNYFKDCYGNTHAIISKDFEKIDKNEIVEVSIPESPQILNY
jgi:hypothetical protein